MRWLSLENHHEFTTPFRAQSKRNWHCPRNGREQMEKALTKVSSLKVGSSWITNKAKKEFSNITDNITESKPLRSLPDLLREYNLPPGLFPHNIICFEFDETKGKLVVYLPSACEVSFKDSSVLRYATRVKGILTKGKLTGIEGMKTKVIVWVKVSTVAVEGFKSDKVCFMAGVKKSRSKDAYDTPRDAVRVSEF